MISLQDCQLSTKNQAKKPRRLYTK